MSGSDHEGDPHERDQRAGREPAVDDHPAAYPDGENRGALAGEKGNAAGRGCRDNLSLRDRERRLQRASIARRLSPLPRKRPQRTDAGEPLLRKRACLGVGVLHRGRKPLHALAEE